MIKSLRLVDFRNFADQIRDAFRSLPGVGRSYRLAEIIGGRFGQSA